MVLALLSLELINDAIPHFIARCNSRKKPSKYNCTKGAYLSQYPLHVVELSRSESTFRQMPLVTDLGGSGMQSNNYTVLQAGDRTREYTGKGEIWRRRGEKCDDLGWRPSTRCGD